MSPFAGDGANLAMLDGAELARALVDHLGKPEGALTAYERDLFPRIARIAEVSACNLARFFGPHAPQSVVELFGRDERTSEAGDAENGLDGDLWVVSTERVAPRGSRGRMQKEQASLRFIVRRRGPAYRD